MYKIVEIFDSIEGEGARSGMTATFIRFAGCNMRCSYCDTTYALFSEPTPCHFTEMTAEQIMNKIHFQRVTLTGGEPLCQPDIKTIINDLDTRGIEINIETNGSFDVSDFRTPHTFFTIDYKLPSSGMERHMCLSTFLNLEAKDVIKFVIGNNEDITRTIQVISEIQSHYLPHHMPSVYLGAVAESFSPRLLAQAMLSRPELKDTRLQVQLHKVINVQ